MSLSVDISAVNDGCNVIGTYSDVLLIYISSSIVSVSFTTAYRLYVPTFFENNTLFVIEAEASGSILS